MDLFGVITPKASPHGLRVAARLVRADDRYAIWSEAYERPLNGILIVHDDMREK
jgi:TolB-like protein